MLLMIIQGSVLCEKALLDVLQGTRTVLKASHCHCARHGWSWEGEPSPTAHSSGCQARSCKAAWWRHRQAHAPWLHGSAREQSCAPGTHSCIRSSPAPRRARTRRASTRGSSTGGSQALHPARSQQSCSSPSRAQGKPGYPRAPLCCSERLCRATKLPDTDPERTQKQWQLGPKMSTWI